MKRKHFHLLSSAVPPDKQGHNVNSWFCETLTQEAGSFQTFAYLLKRHLVRYILHKVSTLGQEAFQVQPFSSVEKVAFG